MRYQMQKSVKDKLKKVNISLVLSLSGLAVYPILTYFIPSIDRFITGILAGYTGFLNRILTSTANTIAASINFSSGLESAILNLLSLIINSAIYGLVLAVKWFTTIFSILSFKIFSMQSDILVKMAIALIMSVLIYMLFKLIFRSFSANKTYIYMLLLYFPISIISAAVIIILQIGRFILNKCKGNPATVGVHKKSSHYKNDSSKNIYSSYYEEALEEFDEFDKKIAQTVKDMFNGANKKVPSEPRNKTQENGNSKTQNTYKKSPNSEHINVNVDTLFKNYIGIEEVKRQVKGIVDNLEYQRKRKLMGLPTEKPGMHMLMLGNPGTGKTSVARIIGEIYKQTGVLPEGEFVEVHRSDLIGEYIGHSERKIRDKIEQAMGGILFIDEAYSLVKKDSKNDFGHDVINILVKEMEDKRDKFVVIAAGYRDKMMEFLADNPGLKDRFQFIIDFRDYNVEELYQIFELFCEKSSYILSEDAKPVLKREIERLYRNKGKDFSNARTIRNLYEQVKSRLSTRVKEYKINDSIGICLIRPEDITDNPIQDSQNLDFYLSQLNGLIGLSEIKKQINELSKYVAIQKERRDRGFTTKPITLHLVMTGNPGTGKTTVAEMLGNIYKSLGLLSSGHIVPASRADLIGEYIGQSESKTSIKFDSAVGGVLFIDEAYSLNREDNSNDFGHAVIEVLLKKMEDCRENIMVVIAGYPEKMGKFLEANPGLKSRFPTVIKFPDYSSEELLEIFKKICTEENFILTEDGEKVLLQQINNVKRDKFFGNAREMRNLFRKAKLMHSVRVSELSQPEKDKELNILNCFDISKIEGKRWNNHRHAC